MKELFKSSSEVHIEYRVYDWIESGVYVPQPRDEVE